MHKYNIQYIIFMFFVSYAIVPVTLYYNLCSLCSLANYCFAGRKADGYSFFLAPGASDTPTTPEGREVCWARTAHFWVRSRQEVCILSLEKKQYKKRVRDVLSPIPQPQGGAPGTSTLKNYLVRVATLDNLYTKDKVNSGRFHPSFP